MRPVGRAVHLVMRRVFVAELLRNSVSFCGAKRRQEPARPQHADQSTEPHWVRGVTGKNHRHFRQVLYLKFLQRSDSVKLTILTIGRSTKKTATRRSSFTCKELHSHSVFSTFGHALWHVWCNSNLSVSNTISQTNTRISQLTVTEILFPRRPEGDGPRSAHRPTSNFMPNQAGTLPATSRPLTFFGCETVTQMTRMGLCD